MAGRRPGLEPQHRGWPRSSDRGESAGDGGKGAVHEAVVGPLAALLAGDEAGVDELAHVVGDSGLGQPDRLDEVADAGAVVAGGRDEGEQLDARGVAESLEDAGQPALPSRSVDDPDLFFLGYGDWCGPASATLIGVGAVARATVDAIVREAAGAAEVSRPL